MPLCWVQCANMWQDCSFTAVQRKHSLCGTVMIHDGLNLRCLDQCHGVHSHGTSFLAGAKELLYSLQSKFDRWVYILVFAEGDCCRFALGKAFPMPLWTSVFFCGCKHQDSPKASPGVIFKWKNLIEPLKLLSWLTGGEGPLCWVNAWWKPSGELLNDPQHAKGNLNMCHSVLPTWATLQFVSCAEKDSLCGTCHDGLNLTCLDQCHGVRSHGTSSSQGWRQRIVIQATV